MAWWAGTPCFRPLCFCRGYCTSRFCGPELEAARKSWKPKFQGRVDFSFIALKSTKTPLKRVSVDAVNAMASAFGAVVLSLSIQSGTRAREVRGADGHARARVRHCVINCRLILQPPCGTPC